MEIQFYNDQDRQAGRFPFAVVGMCICLIVFLLWIYYANLPIQGKLYTIQAGDTLWSIANQYYSEKDPHHVVVAIQQQNHLPGSVIHPGQTIMLP